MVESSYSEDVATLDVNVTGIVQRGSLTHRLAIGHTLPDASLNVLTVLHGVLFHLLDVAFLGRAVPSTDALVIASVERISLLEGSKERLLSHLSLLLRESNVSTISGEVGVESAALTHRV